MINDVDHVYFLIKSFVMVKKEHEAMTIYLRDVTVIVLDRDSPMR